MRHSSIFFSIAFEMPILPIEAQTTLVRFVVDCCSFVVQNLQPSDTFSGIFIAQKCACGCGSPPGPAVEFTGLLDPLAALRGRLAT